MKPKHNVLIISLALCAITFFIIILINAIFMKKPANPTPSDNPMKITLTQDIITVDDKEFLVTIYEDNGTYSSSVKLLTK